MRYVHVAESHRRELPPEVLEAAAGEVDPDRRILKLLGGRAKLRQPDGNKEKAHENLVGFKYSVAGWTGLEAASAISETLSETPPWPVVRRNRGEKSSRRDPTRSDASH